MLTRIAAPAAAALALAIAGLLLLLQPVLSGKDRDPESPAPATSGQDPTPSLSAPASPQTSPSGAEDAHSHDHEDDQSVLRAQRRVVAAFARAFTAPGSQQGWLKKLRPLVTADLLRGFELTDPTRRPRGALRQVTAIAEPPGLYVVHYDNQTRLRVNVELVAGTWRVAHVEPIKPPDPSGTDV